MICDCDGDPPLFYRSSVLRARGTHKCFECAGVISPGESYEYVAGKWDGEVESFRTCERCYDLRVWVKNSVPCFCWAHGNMLDDARAAIEAARRRAPDEARGLRFGFLRRKALIVRHVARVLTLAAPAREARP